MKKLVLPFILLIAVGVSTYVVWKKFFTPPVAPPSKRTKYYDKSTKDLTMIATYILAGQRNTTYNISFTGTEMRSLLSGNDYCLISQKSKDTTRNYFYDFSQKLLSLPDYAPLLPGEKLKFQSLFEIEAFPNIQRSALPILNFYNALLISNLIENSKPPYIDSKKAETLLSELMKKNPDNGAFPYFLAMVKSQTKHDQKEIDELLYKAFVAKEFNTYRSELAFYLWQKGLQNITHMFVAQEVISKLPSPNFRKNLNLVFKAFEKNKNLEIQVIEFAKKLMDSTLKKVHLRSEFALWNESQYEAGRMIYSKAWSAHSPSVALPLEYKTTTQELVKYDHWPQRLSGASHCDTAGPNQYLSHKRKEFLEFRRK